MDFIDELLDTYDAIDIGTQATAIDKNFILTTCGAGKMGDKYPIKLEEIKSWRSFRADYFALVEKKSVLAQSLRRLLAARTSELICRCFKSENAEVLFDKLSARWKKIKI